MKKTQAILKKLNIVASSLEEMSFLQESNEIHKVFIKIVSNHNTRFAQDENLDPQDENLDPDVKREQQDHTGFLFYDNDKSQDIKEIINKLKELFSGQRTYRVNQNNLSKAEAAKTYYNAVRSHSPLFDPSKPEGILNRTYLDEEYNKLLIESQKRRINYNSAYEGIKRYILDGEGKTEFDTVQDYILSLNAIEEQNIKLMDFAKYVERLKVLSPNLDMKTYNFANQALYQAKLKAKSGSELNFRNVGSVNKILKNMLDKGELEGIDIYFIAIEMARLSSVIREN
jgi:hypothetical protein